MTLGVLTGAGIGLRFHREDWLGGYGSFRRRMVRLGHISCFGIGLLNLAFAGTLAMLHVPAGNAWARIGAAAWVVAQVGMPAGCFLTAWREPFRHGFALPVGAALLGTWVALGLVISTTAARP
jgi:hypothetical protein